MSKLPHRHSRCSENSLEIIHNVSKDIPLSPPIKNLQELSPNQSNTYSILKAYFSQRTVHQYHAVIKNTDDNV